MFGLLAVSPAAGQDLQGYLNKFFGGGAMRYGYGDGNSSSSPRVDVEIHYCASGRYISGGQSCVANGGTRSYRCSGVRDSGDWQVAILDGRAVMQLVSAQSGTREVELMVDANGVVMDAAGNAFYRISKAACQ